MKTISIILLFLIACHTKVFSQTVKLDWAKQMVGSSFDICQAITLDEDGNIYATGYYSTVVDFDPGPRVFNLTSVNAEDIFLCKYDSTGKLNWAKSIGDFRYQAGYAIALDTDKNIYITGIFFGTTDFDPGPGETKLTSAGNEDVFICKFDNSGNFKWAKSFGGPSNDFSNAILLDRFGNIYINGYFDGSSDFDPSNGVFTLTSIGSTDIYISKFSNDGSLQWAKQIGGSSSEAAYSIGLDEQNNVYSTGFFWGTVDFDPGSGVFNLQSNGFGDGFILKLSTNGDFIRAGKLGSTNAVRCTSLKLDHTGNMYVTGHFDGDANFDPNSGSTILSAPIGEEDVFVAKYNLDFDLLWARQIGGPSYQKAFAIDVDEEDNVYVTGHYNGTSDFDPGSGIVSLTALGDPDIFVLKLTDAGDYVWVAQAAGTFYGSGYTLKVDRSNNIFVAGTFEGSIDFDPSAEIFQLSSAGESEIFIQKLRQCPNAAIPITLNIVTCSSYKLYNKTYYSSGTYIHPVLNILGCDSIRITLNLTITRLITDFLTNICEGQSWLAGGKLQTKTGVYYDTLTTSLGCDSVIITNLTVHPAPKPSLGPDRNICQGETFLLSPGNFSSYLWQDLSTQPSFMANAPGTYRVTVTNQYNCTGSARLIIRKVIVTPSYFLPPDQTLCTGNVLLIEVPGFKNYSWNSGSTTQNLAIRTAGVYTLTVTDFDNCMGTDVIQIQEIDCIPIGIPNSFTPNDDGINDFFRPRFNREITAYQMKIFNRRGQILFISNHQDKGWDGRFKTQKQETGTYVYLIQGRDIAGKQFNYSGNIILIR